MASEQHAALAYKYLTEVAETMRMMLSSRLWLWLLTISRIRCGSVPGCGFAVFVNPKPRRVSWSCEEVQHLKPGIFTP